MICESNGRVGLAMSKERQWAAIWLDQEGSPPLSVDFLQCVDDDVGGGGCEDDYDDGL